MEGMHNPTIARFSPRRMNAVTNSPKMKEDLYRKVLSKNATSSVDETQLAAEIGSSLLEYASVLEKDLEVVQNENSQIEGEIEMLQMKLMEVQSNLLKMNGHYEQAIQRNGRLEEQISELDDEKKRFEERIRKLESEISLLKMENNDISTSHEEQQQVQSNKSNFDVKKDKELQQLRKENFELNKLIEEYNFQLQAFERTRKSHMKDDERVSSCLKRIDELEKQLESLESVNERLKKDLDELNGLLCEYQTESKSSPRLKATECQDKEAKGKDVIDFMLDSRDRLRLMRTSSSMCLRDAKMYVPLSFWFKQRHLFANIRHDSLETLDLPENITKAHQENVFLSPLEGEKAKDTNSSERSPKFIACSFPRKNSSRRKVKSLDEQVMSFGAFCAAEQEHQTDQVLEKKDLSKKQERISNKQVEISNKQVKISDKKLNSSKEDENLSFISIADEMEENIKIDESLLLETIHDDKKNGNIKLADVIKLVENPHREENEKTDESRKVIENPEQNCHENFYESNIIVENSRQQENECIVDKPDRIVRTNIDESNGIYYQTRSTDHGDSSLNDDGLSKGEKEVKYTENSNNSFVKHKISLNHIIIDENVREENCILSRDETVKSLESLESDRAELELYKNDISHSKQLPNNVNIETAAPVNSLLPRASSNLPLSHENISADSNESCESKEMFTKDGERRTSQRNEPNSQLHSLYVPNQTPPVSEICITSTTTLAEKAITDSFCDDAASLNTMTHSIASAAALSPFDATKLDASSPLTPLMMGCWLHKCPRPQTSKLLSASSISVSKLHKRFFWLNPFSKTLFWGEGDSSFVQKTKHISIARVELIEKFYQNASKSTAALSVKSNLLLVHSGRKERMLLYSEDHTVIDAWFKSSQPMQIGILGGGISGLSSAFYAAKYFPSSKISILEKSKRLGGWMNSTTILTREHKFIFENGPQKLRCTSPNMPLVLEIIDAVGMRNEIIVNSSSLEPFLFDGKWRTKGQLALSTAPKIIAEFGKWRRMMPVDGKEESVHSFISRKYGPLIAEYFSAFCKGIYGVGSELLGANSIIPSLVQYEKKYGSVGLGMICEKLMGKKESQVECVTGLYEEVRKKQVLWLKKGFSYFIDNLERYLISKNCAVELQTECKSISESKDKIVVGDCEFDFVISCLPLSILSNLIQYKSEFTPKETSLSIIQAAYSSKPNVKDGFGYLCLDRIKSPIVGASFDFWRNQNSLSIFMPYSESDGMLEKGLGVFKEQTGCTEDPIYSRVVHAEKAFPLLSVGYADYVKNLKNFSDSKFRGKLLLAGPSMVGVGVPDCIKSGYLAIQSIKKQKEK